MYLSVFSRCRKSSTNAQQTLAFGPHANKVTKPSSATTSAKNVKASPSQLSKAISTTPEVQDSKPTKIGKEEVTEIPNLDRGLAFRVQGSQPRDELDEKARRIPEKQIKAYWRTQEDERKAPRGMNLSSPIYCLRSDLDPTPLSPNRDTQIPLSNPHSFPVSLSPIPPS